MRIWPFKKREPRPDWRRDAIARLQAWRKIGETFEYLGRQCVVTGHFEQSFHDLGVSTFVQLSADYADDLGVIRNVSFGWQEAKALMERHP
jgi:hypothetical protein